MNNRKKVPNHSHGGTTLPLGSSGGVTKAINFEGTGFGENILDQSYNSSNTSNISIPVGPNFHITYGSNYVNNNNFKQPEQKVKKQNGQNQ